jgi:hypothetical protein
MSIVSRSLANGVQKDGLRQPFIARLRAGAKKLSNAAKANPRAVAIYNKGREQGFSFSRIGQLITAEFPDLKTPLYPVNTPYFSVHPSELTHSPEVAKQLAERGNQADGIESLPIVLAGDTVDEAIVDRYEGFKVFGGEPAWSQYGEDGKRYCMTLPAVAKGSSRVKTTRRVPNIKGICLPDVCQAFGSGKCKYKASLYFRIPGIPTAQPFVLETSSMIATEETVGTLNEIVKQTGTLPKLHEGRPIFWLTKKLARRTYVDENGQKKVGEQFVPVLVAEVDITTLVPNVPNVPMVPSLEAAIAQAVPAESLPQGEAQPESKKEPQDSPMLEGAALTKEYETLFAKLGDMANESFGRRYVATVINGLGKNARAFEAAGKSSVILHLSYLNEIHPRMFLSWLKERVEILDEELALAEFHIEDTLKSICMQLQTA